MGKNMIIATLSIIIILMGAYIAVDVHQEKEQEDIQMQIQYETTDVREEVDGSENVVSEEPENNYINIVSEKANGLSGNVQWGIKLFDTNFSYTSQSYPVQSASVIKVYIMEYIYYLEQQGKVNVWEHINGQQIEQLITNMITYSDNSATNVLIDFFGMDSLNDFFVSQGYLDTRLERKMLDTMAMNAGKENYTSIRDVMSFLDKIYMNKEMYPYSKMLEIMKNQQVKTKIPQQMPVNVIIANKTGELSGVENDIGIVFTEKGDFAIAFLCSSLADVAATRRFISDSTLAVYEEFVFNRTENVYNNTEDEF